MNVRTSRLSIIVPCLNEAAVIQYSLGFLQSLRRQGHEVILVDGGSTDATRELAIPLVDQLLSSSAGRGQQMNAGGRVARGDILWFLHADSDLPIDAGEVIIKALATSGSVWGRFDVTLSGRHPLLRMVAFMMNQRSRLTGIATGDQGIFVRRFAFDTVGGFPEIPLMEDIVLSQRLKRLTSPLCLRQRIVTSSRRWESHGIMRTVLLMWWLRLAFALGASPEWLAQKYSPCNTLTPES